MKAHIEITVKVPADLDIECAQRINQVVRAVMEQFPGIDDGPQHPARMFRTTLATFKDKLENEIVEGEPTKVEVVEDQDDVIEPDTSALALAELVESFTASWGTDEVDRASVLLTALTGKHGHEIKKAIESTPRPEKLLIDAGATPEQSSNLIAVATAMQLFQI